MLTADWCPCYPVRETGREFKGQRHPEKAQQGGPCHLELPTGSPAKATCLSEGPPRRGQGRKGEQDKDPQRRRGLLTSQQGLSLASLCRRRAGLLTEIKLEVAREGDQEQV